MGGKVKEDVCGELEEREGEVVRKTSWREGGGVVGVGGSEVR
jgi:hypothetical protein